MAGVKGRSGRKALPAEAHILNGTFRPDRHGPRPAAAVVGATAISLPMVVSPVPSTLVTGLRAPGRTFVTKLWERYAEWGPVDLVLLRQAAEVVDALADYRTRITKDGCLLKGIRGKRYPHPLLRVQGQARGMLRGLLAQLNLEK